MSVRISERIVPSVLILLACAFVGLLLREWIPVTREMTREEIVDVYSTYRGSSKVFACGRITVTNRIWNDGISRQSLMMEPVVQVGTMKLLIREHSHLVIFPSYWDHSVESSLRTVQNSADVSGTWRHFLKPVEVVLISEASNVGGLYEVRKMTVHEAWTGVDPLPRPDVDSE